MTTMMDYIFLKFYLNSFLTLVAVLEFSYLYGKQEDIIFHIFEKLAVEED